MITRAPTIDQSDMDFVYGEDGAINLSHQEKGEKQKPLRRSSQVFEEDPPVSTVRLRTLEHGCDMVLYNWIITKLNFPFTL